jgi:hypothetical protein
MHWIFEARNVAFRKIGVKGPLTTLPLYCKPLRKTSAANNTNRYYRINVSN